jgi:hypothetical protein
MNKKSVFTAARLIMSGAIVGISITNIILGNTWYPEYSQFLGASIGGVVTAAVLKAIHFA